MNDFASRDTNRLTKGGRKVKSRTKRRIDQLHSSKQGKSAPPGRNFTAQNMIAHNKPHTSHLASAQHEGRQMRKCGMTRG